MHYASAQRRTGYHTFNAQRLGCLACCYVILITTKPGRYAPTLPYGIRYTFCKRGREIVRPVNEGTMPLINFLLEKESY